MARYVKPMLREFRARRDKYGIPEEWKQRSSFIEWNYRAELYAFGQRLHEQFDQKLLAQAFVDRSYVVQEEQRQREVQIENPVVDMKDNAELVVRGEEILREYVLAFLQYSLPRFPLAGLNAVREHLLSEEQLAKIGKNLGTVDIILSDVSNPAPRRRIEMNIYYCFVHSADIPSDPTPAGQHAEGDHRCPRRIAASRRCHQLGCRLQFRP